MMCADKVIKSDDMPNKVCYCTTYFEDFQLIPYAYIMLFNKIKTDKLIVNATIYLFFQCEDKFHPWVFD